MKWLEDLFFLAAFVVAVALVTFSVYDGNGAPKPGPASVVAAAQNPEREMPAARADDSREVVVVALPSRVR